MAIPNQQRVSFTVGDFAEESHAPLIGRQMSGLPVDELALSLSETDAKSRVERALESDSEDEPLDDRGLPFMSGVISKWTNYLNGWQDRWLVLRNGVLSYYKSQKETDQFCRGTVDIRSSKVMPHQYDECRFDIQVGDKCYYLRAPSKELRKEWVQSLNDSQGFPLCEGSLNHSGSKRSLKMTSSCSSLLSVNSVTNLTTYEQRSKEGIRIQTDKLNEIKTLRKMLASQIASLHQYAGNTETGSAEHMKFKEELIPHSVRRLRGLG